MIVTDLKYGLDAFLVKKLDLMIDRCVRNNPKQDALLINEGGEGEGKSNTSIAEAYYIKQETGRDIYLFFRLKELIEFAKTNHDKILIWDEPSLDSLTVQHYRKVNIELMQLLMTYRKLRNFLIINMTKFWKFSEYIVVDRCLGMVHMYSKRGVTIGNFVYIKRNNLERLFLGYKTSKRRQYFKYGTVKGSIPNVMEKHFDKMGITVVGIDGKIYPNATYEVYEKEKDKAILSIGVRTGKTDIEKGKEELRLFKHEIGKRLQPPINTKKELAEQLGISEKTLYKWARSSETGDKGTP
jgi:hypothetical protein